MRFIYFVLIFSAGMLISFTSKASHIVGGNFSYTCLGNNIYQIHLRIYRDSTNGGPPFDRQAEIVIYNGNDSLINILNVPHSEVIVLPPEIDGNPCVSAPPDYVVHYTDYIDTVSLPPTSSGYILVYQACCRNKIIGNLINPGSVSSTYAIDIPPMDTLCNSSPKLVKNPPPVLCLNTNIEFKLELGEKDGDSLYYELCGPLARDPNGPSSCLDAISNTYIVCPPPYPAVPYAQTFSALDPLPANPAFAINNMSGQLSGMPNQLGVFVVGICVSEYGSNGQLKSTWRFDYQYSVVNCKGNVLSDMVTPDEDPEILCDGLTVNFVSEVQNYDVLWVFGDPSTQSDTSSLPNPSYTYPQPGIYPVMLIAGPFTPCADTVIVNFDINVPAIPKFFYNGQTCFEAQNVLFRVSGGYPTGTSFEWDFGPNANIPIHQGISPPVIKWDTPGKHYITLTIRYGACEFSVTDSIDISYLTATIDAGPDQTIQAGEIAYLNATDGVSHYWWAEKDGIEISSRITQGTAIRFEEPDTVKIYVRITDIYNCDGIDSLTIIVLANDVPAPINFFSPDGNGLNEVLDLSELNPKEECDITIFNRWGSEVWARENYQNDWNGVNRGGYDLPDGTYYYVLRCAGRPNYKAAITLVRNP